MPINLLRELATDGITCIEQVGGRVEDVFAQVGGQLGMAHDMFAELNAGMESLSDELSGTKMEGASTAFQDIATRLQELADSLPAETAILGSIGASAAHASTLLKQIIKSINLIGVIARSSRIEAATLEGSRDDFLSFTREASKLAAAVEVSVEACSKEQEQVEAAIAVALDGQQAFEAQYRGQLLSASKALIATALEIKKLQVRGIRVARMGKAATSQIGQAVGTAIISLQSGDSGRQRLEHICGGLRLVADRDGAIGRSSGALVCRLQAAQLRCTVTDFAIDIGKVNLSLVQLSADSVAMVTRGNALFGANNDEMASFLSLMKQRLGEASTLIIACAREKISVDRSIAQLEEVLGKFHATIAALRETVVDITLIGMNAGLKACHLGAKGRAFVEIANELKQAADRISGAENLLRPVLAEIGRLADRLKASHKQDQQLDVADLEQSIGAAAMEIERGNGRLLDLMDHLTRESIRFDSVMKDGMVAMSGLNAKFASLPAIATFLEEPSRDLDGIWPEELLEAEELLEGLYQLYTMDAERETHRTLAEEFGIACKFPSPATMAAAQASQDVDALFF